jgi:hypothetical protein
MNCDRTLSKPYAAISGRTAAVADTTARIGGIHKIKSMHWSTVVYRGLLN